MPRFEDDLLRHMHVQDTDEEGVRDCWIKAIKHTNLYQTDYPNHTEGRGGRWNREVTKHYNIHEDIVIYKVGTSNENYFVLPTDHCRTLFQDSHVGWRLKLRK